MDNSDAVSKGTLVLAFILAGAVSLSSCATSSGGSYDRGSSSEASAFRRAATEKDSKSSDSHSGGGSHSGSFWPNPEPESVLILEPRVPTGLIVVTDAPPGAVIYVDDLPSGRSPIRVKTGLRVVRIVAFGWQDYERPVFVSAHDSAVVRYVGGRSPFSILSFAAHRSSFDPTSPGMTGSVRLEGSLSAPGIISAQVQALDGRVVRHFDDLAVDEASFSFWWDGRDDEGKRLPYGRYSVLASGAGVDDAGAILPTRAKKAEAPVLMVGRASRDRYASLFSGLSGSALTPDAQVLPAGSAQVWTGFVAHTELQDISSDATDLRAPTVVGVRTGLPIFAGAEAALSLMLVPRVDSSGLPLSSGDVSGSFKMKLFDTASLATAQSSSDYSVSTAFSIAGYGRLTLGGFVDEAAGGWPSPWDPALRFPGAACGIVADYAAGPARAFVAGELDAGLFYPAYDGDAEVPSLYGWAYLRVGADALVRLGAPGTAVVAVSAALRTGPAGFGSSLSRPFLGSGEITWYPPHTPVSVGAIATVEADAPNSYFVSGGASLGFAF